MTVNKKVDIQKLNLMDDAFLNVVLQNKDACEYVLETILGKRINLTQVETQKSFRSISEHSIIEDVFAMDDENNTYDIEVQKRNNDNMVKRAEFYLTQMTSPKLHKREKYNNMTNTYVIFITSFAVFPKNRIIYHMDMTLRDSPDIVCTSTLHAIFVNSTIRDGSKLSKLMEYFENSSLDNDDFGAIIGRGEKMQNNRKGEQDYE